jgi:capsular polysaccharide biosynthesis protein
VLSSFFARRCTVLVDHAQGADKRRRYAAMRARVPRAAGPRTRVYVRRTGGDRRVLREEEALIAALERRGFVVLVKGVDPVERVVDLCSRAEQIVGLDGSHLAPCLLIAPEGAELVTVVRPGRVSLALYEFAQAAGIRTAVYVSDGEAAVGREEELSVDVDALLRFVGA